MGAFVNRGFLRALILIASATLTASSASAQAIDDVAVLPTNVRSFTIPFNVTGSDHFLLEVQLFVSRDRGQTWEYAATAAPANRCFTNFTATKDGEYWFCVRTVDQQGRAYPPSDREFKPGLKFLVDTMPPVVNLRLMQVPGTNVGIEWAVADANLELKTLRLEYHSTKGGPWVPVQIDHPATSGQQTISPMTNGPLEVRLTVRDSAGNHGEGTVSVSPGTTHVSASSPISAGMANAADAVPSVSSTLVRHVNTTKISLNYSTDQVGPSGVGSVELWYTHDGRNWQRYPIDAKDVGPPLVVNVQGPGMYGITVSARSGVGVGDNPPQYGEPPQVWVEVDTSPPVVQLVNVEVGQGADAGDLTITWTASDKNFGPQPISISYAETPAGPWYSIADKIENRGKFVWKMPPPGQPPAGVPFKFLVQVEAADKAGNVGSAVTKDQVLVDLSRPKAAIVDIAGSGPK